MPSGRPSHVWTNEEIALLGTMSDKDISLKLRVPNTTVARKRTELNIPAFVPKVSPTREELIEELRSCKTLTEMANRRGVTKQAVSSLLKARKINPREVLPLLRDQPPKEDFAGKIVDGRQVLRYAGLGYNNRRMWWCLCPTCKREHRVPTQGIHEGTQIYCHKCTPIQRHENLTQKRVALGRTKENIQTLMDQEMTISEVAEHLGISRSRVCQIRYNLKRSRRKE